MSLRSSGASSEPSPTHELLALARRAADAGAAELTARFGQHLHALRAKSSPTDPVSAVDLASESAIRAVLTRERPDDRILGEEGGYAGGEGPLRWIVDPLDGTVNYLYGIPVFAVSVACEDRDGMLVGVVLDPVRGECFSAHRDGPAMRDGTVVSRGTGPPLEEALVGTGFAYEASVRARQAEIASKVLPRVRDIRRGGSAALDLCWCACGRLDAFYERGIKLWDRAAGGLICSRAGLAVRLLAARDDLPEGVLVAPAPLIEELARLVD